MSAQWDIAPPPPREYVDALRALHPLTAAVLHSRGYAEPERALAFVQGKFDPVDPFALKDMDRAVERITAAINGGEAIAIYGDYDCDGVTSCALLMRALGSLGARVRVYLPNRFDEGYGLNSAALDKLKAEGVSLVVTVDCGARAAREADHARAIGLDLIITDHHELDLDRLPAAVALVNPKQPGCAYPFKLLAGVGVTFRLAQALLRTLKRPGAVTERSLLDLVALGTVADVVSMTGENRLLVRAGLDVINTAPVPGIVALMRSAGVKLGTVDAGKIGFMLAPRLNAAGRLDDARAAYELLICADPVEAETLAAQLSLQNEQRQLLTAAIADDAEQRALVPDADTPLLFAAHVDYNAGVIGLAAARLVERFYRPAIVVSISDGEARGSCRSVHGFHMTQALDQCAMLLSKHGGHAAAAGFTLPAARVEALRAALTGIARGAQPESGWQRVIKIAAEVELADVNAKAYAELCKLEPHGPDNPRPVFASRGATVVDAKRVGKSESGIGPHLKLKLRDGRRSTWDAMFWRAGDRLEQIGDGALIDVAFVLDENEWNGRRSLQLVVQDFRARE
jgi:single-stranded-DNA-specific exonuclease